ncbi:putative DNA-binding transcriptional regulator YafY [Hydrogenophaga palleronii]|uniref:DNA-binding transcriptional regulator YafY n=1 Tax=Hydrogenophaga palleronii TaxID=65655 RepID=A0ABU1WPV5_9BURK|nr:YafY family protein [Hydrogenophaga palleronii]MDR7151318.1 putative DNA-binding transcriptional regulator YafY [Hydrogenophaga palleronii]
MKASRLLSILMLLQARGRMTASSLAQALEVSPRTILRDIDQLSAAGVPLWGERGHQGGFQLQPGWSTQLTGMTESEAHALLLAGLPGPATELGLGAAAASARLKLVASLPAAWREQADRVGERLHIDPVDWYRARDTPRFLREVADAVWRGRRLSVRYESWRGTSLHELEPLGLVLKAGAWYLLARKANQEGWRTYRLASMHSVTTGGRSFKRPRGFDLASAWETSARRFEAELRAMEVRALVSPRGLTWLGNARIQVVVLPLAHGGSKARRGWREVLLSVESIEHGARQLLSYGAEIEVLAPPAMRAEVHRLAGLLMVAHQKPVA